MSTETKPLNKENLLAEQAGLAARFTAAVTDGDSKALLDLQLRSYQLPTEIRVAEIVERRAQIAELEATLPAREQRVETSFKARGVADKNAEKATEKAQGARMAHMQALESLTMTRGDIAAKQRHLAELERAAKPAHNPYQHQGA